jgi:hypothetical protein
MVRQRQALGHESPTHDLVQGIVPAYVLPYGHQLTVAVKEPGCMQTSGAFEHLLCLAQFRR